MSWIKKKKFVNIFHNKIYPNLTKNVENKGQILFTIRLMAFTVPIFMKPINAAEYCVQTTDIGA